MKCPRCGYQSGISKDYAKDIRKSYKRAFLPWTPEEDQHLASLASLASIPTIAEAMGRQPNAIKRRMELLNIVYNAPQTLDSAEPDKAWVLKEQEDLKKLKGESK